MTDVAQHMAKTIVAVTPKAPGKTVQKGRNIATVESGKWVGPVPAPVSGEIVAVNDALAATPSLVNSDPYGAGGSPGCARRTGAPMWPTWPPGPRASRPTGASWTPRGSRAREGTGAI